jgi:hypothetical protein
MFKEAYRSTFKLYATVCFVAILLSQITPNTIAAVIQSEKEQKTAHQTQAISHLVPGDVAAGRASQDSDQQTTETNSQQPGASAPTTPSTPTATPLTSGQKFKYFARSSFFPPMPYALSVLSGVFSEATDNDHGRHMTAGDFMADSMTHAARSFAFRATANLFEKYAFASAFKQDPRYFRSDKKGFGRVGYAVSRVFITRSDSGHDQFNASFFAGGLVAAGISNAWVRPEDRNVSSTMSRFGIHVAYKALSNIVSELFGKK